MLWAELKSLREMAGEAFTTLTEAQEAAEPFKRAFWEAHEEAGRMVKKLNAYPDQCTRADVLAAYDRRVEAGIAYAPIKQRVKDLSRWHRDVQKELRNIEDELHGEEPQPEEIQSVRVLVQGDLFGD